MSDRNRRPPLQRTFDLLLNRGWPKRFPVYRAERRCPDCGHSAFHIGRTTAECASCEMPLALPEALGHGAATFHTSPAPRPRDNHSTGPVLFRHGRNVEGPGMALGAER